MSRIKRSQLAGRWYAGAAARLRAEVAGWLASGEGRAPAGPHCALLVPHAGYAYSGRAAGAGYACVAGGGYERAVILAPSHFVPFRGVAVLDVDGFETPLGVVPVDGAGRAQLLGSPLVAERPEAFEDEHALEIQLPFLQLALPAASVVPALVGELAPDDAAVLGPVLAALADDRTLFVISSDFVHYGWRFGYLPFPAVGAEAVREGLRRLDMGAIERVCAGDGGGFVAYVADTGATICGRHPIELFLAVPPGPRRGQLVTYYTSLDVTGDYEHVVSYASIVFPRRGIEDAGGAVR